MLQKRRSDRVTIIFLFREFLLSSTKVKWESVKSISMREEIFTLRPFVTCTLTIVTNNKITIITTFPILYPPISYSRNAIFLQENIYIQTLPNRFT